MVWLRLLIILGLVGLAEYYSYVVLRSALRTSAPGWRTGISIAYLALTAMSWLALILFRKLDWAHMPHMLRNIFVAYIIGFVVAKLLILLVMLVDDLRRLMIWVVQLFITQGKTVPPVDEASGGISRSVFLERLALILGGTALGGFLYGITNRYNYHVRRVQIKFANLPEAFRGMRLVQISDIHAGSFDDEKAVTRGIRQIMSENPDLIVFTGDLVNNKAEELEPYKHVFRQLKAPMGVYSILGNHDYGDYVNWPSPQAKRQNLESLKAGHAHMGWRLLVNEHVKLERNGQSIALIGVENWSNKRNFPRYGRMDLATAGINPEQTPFRILLSHDPSHWDAEVLHQYQDVDLTLSGHTHGMQFGVEIPGIRWSPVQYVYKNWAGLYQEGRQYLYVNRGFGFLGYPGRLGIMPEITVIELV
jgi:predicted MPP superfamily phosphohydrolase